MNKKKITTNRRDFIKQSSIGLGLSVLPFSSFPDLLEEKKLGVALVGLGGYSTGQLAPALQKTKYCKLSGIVTGTPSKIPTWQEKYNIPEANIYNYDNFDRIAENDSIDIIYVVLPNAMHADYVIRAAQAGKHVICEKPFDVSVKKSAAAVEAVEKAGKKLQIGYRCQYDPTHDEIRKIGKEKRMGDIKLIRSSFSFYGVKGDNWRYTDKALAGGGPLMDVGIYCIQAVRKAMGEEPIAVRATAYNTYPNLMDGMEETILFSMEFPSGVMASVTSSYAARANFIEISAEKGNYGMQPAFGYAGANGFMGQEKMDFPKVPQQAYQMDAFARNILDDTPVLASGLDGLQDMRIIEAIYKSAKKNGKRVKV